MGVNSIPSVQPATTGYSSDKPGQDQAPQSTPQQASTYNGAIGYGNANTEAVSFDSKKVPEGSGEQGGIRGALTTLGEKTSLVPGFSNVAKGAGEDGVKGAIGGVMQTLKNNAQGIIDDIKQGDVPLSLPQLAVSSYKGNIAASEDVSERTKAAVAKL
jgi:hypothetical protein